MIFGVVADIHGNFDAMHAAMARHPDVPFWLCVGDLASRAGAYPEPIAPLYWIKGNNDNFDAIENYVNGTLHTPNLHYIPNGTATRIGDLVVAGLGGTYAPSVSWCESTLSATTRAPGSSFGRAAWKSCS